MRWFHLAVIVFFAAATIVFAVQNLDTVTISFFKMNLSLPLALQTLVVSRWSRDRRQPVRPAAAFIRRFETRRRMNQQLDARPSCGTPLI